MGLYVGLILLNVKVSINPCKYILIPKLTE